MMQRPGVLDVWSHTNDPFSKSFKNFFINARTSGAVRRGTICYRNTRSKNRKRRAPFCESVQGIKRKSRKSRQPLQRGDEAAAGD